MKRIDIVYAGRPYFLAGRSAESVRGEISAGVDSGTAHWFRVNTGEGRRADAFLLIGPGIPVVVVDSPEDGPDSPELTAADAVGLDVTSSL